ncbi:MAG: cytochrome c [Chitinophagales bacterium]|nr:MAG: cytochrome c [Chitinophagales bacterium]
MKRNRLHIIGIVLLAGIWSSCGKDPRKPGRIYMPDMTYSQAYETYAPNPNFKDGQTARMPVEGTIPRGALPPEVLPEGAHKSYLFKKYYSPHPDDYERAGVELSNPLPLTDEVLAEGKRIYTTYCQVCHGEKGDGQGSIVTSGAYPPVNPYSTLLKDKPEGKMFYSITYGRNLMGSYASQLTPDERWKVIYYIQKLSGMGRFAASPAAATSQTN